MVEQLEKILQHIWKTETRRDGLKNAVTRETKLMQTIIEGSIIAYKIVSESSGYVPTNTRRLKL